VCLKSKADPERLPGLMVKTASAIDDPRADRFVLYPPEEKMRFEFSRLFDRVWKQGGWLINIDELYYVDHLLKLAKPINKLLTQGRSKGITLMSGMQRPVMISRWAISQSSHVIVFLQEGRDAKTVADATSPRMQPIVQKLKRYQCAWFYRPTRQIWTGYAQDLGVS
jgi:hypothetical protein